MKALREMCKYAIPTSIMGCLTQVNHDTTIILTWLIAADMAQAQGCKHISWNNNFSFDLPPAYYIYAIICTLVFSGGEV